MKKSLPLLVLLLLSWPAFSQFYNYMSDTTNNPPSLIKRLGIKSDSIVCITKQNGKKRIKIGIENYDTEGRVIERRLTFADKKFTIIDSFFYRPDGQLAKTATYGNKAFPPYYEETKEYNEKGQLTGSYSVSRTQKDTSHIRNRLEYNSAGQLRYLFFQRDDKPEYKMESYQYDAAGRQLRIDHFRADGSFWYTTTYEYNDREKTKYEQHAKGAPNKHTFFYDKQGRYSRIESTISKSRSKHEYDYNDDGTLHTYKHDSPTTGNILRTTTTERHHYRQ